MKHVFLVFDSVSKPGWFDIKDTRTDTVVETLETRKEALTVKKIYEATKSARPPAKIPKQDAERLTGVAIIREGETHKMLQGGHWQLRNRLGDDDPNRRQPGDQEGFWTSKDRFVDRDEAQDIAVESGQIRGKMGRDLLSSDIRW